MSKIEVLFPEIANLSGEQQNISYLKRCSEKIEVIEDYLDEEPAFLNEYPDMIYLGMAIENGQKMIIEKLRPYRDKIIEMIDNNVLFLITGNSIEIFGKSIENDMYGNIEALDIFPFVSKQEMLNRYNSLYLGDFIDGDEKIKIVGFMSQFGHIYHSEYKSSPISDYDAAFNTIKKADMNNNDYGEGIRKNNFIATYLQGPILIVNPLFTKWLMKKIGIENPMLEYEKDIMKAYEERLSEFSDPKQSFAYEQ